MKITLKINRQHIKTNFHSLHFLPTRQRKSAREISKHQKSSTSTHRYPYKSSSILALEVKKKEKKTNSHGRDGGKKAAPIQKALDGKNEIPANPGDKIYGPLKRLVANPATRAHRRPRRHSGDGGMKYRRIRLPFAVPTHAAAALKPSFSLSPSYIYMCEMPQRRRCMHVYAPLCVCVCVYYTGIRTAVVTNNQRARPLQHRFYVPICKGDVKRLARDAAADPQFKDSADAA